MSPRRRLLVAALLVVALAAVTLVITLGRGNEPLSSADEVDQGDPGPVLLVTGYGGGTSALDGLAAALRTGGREATVIPVVGDGTGDLREQAEALASAADAAIAAGAPSVDVVGYSAGGVVARVWAAELGGASVARRIVTLGSPHHGAEVAALGATLLPESCPAACQALVPGSDLLSGLEETPAGPHWTAIWSTGDQVVTPPDSARLAGAVNIPLQGVCPGAQIDHGALPTDPLPVGLVTLALAVAPLEEAPSPARCTELRSAGAALGAAPS